jgi:hypothetical protein
MYFPKTGELQTFWTNYTCDDPNCPGKHHEHRRPSSHNTNEWLIQASGGRKRKSLISEGMEP